MLKLRLLGFLLILTNLFAFELPAPQEPVKQTPAEILATANEYEEKRLSFYRKLAWDGIRVRGLYEKTPDSNIIVYMIVPNSPGEKAGILPGDIILTMNGKVAKDFTSSSLFHFMTSLEIGEELIYVLKRDGKKLKIPVLLSAPTEAVMAEWLLETRAKKKKMKKEKAISPK